MKIEDKITLTEDISDYYLNMNPEMYYDKEDLEMFVDYVLAEVIEKTGKEDLRLFSIYLSDDDKLTIVLEDKDNVFGTEIKVNPMTSRKSKGVLRYLDNAVDGLVDEINRYRDLFEMKLKINESTVSVDFDEWADQITFDEYRTVAKLRKFSKEHPEYRKNILSLRDQIRNIFSNAYLESINEAINDSKREKKLAGIPEIIDVHKCTWHESCDIPHEDGTMIIRNRPYRDDWEFLSWKDLGDGLIVDMALRDPDLNTLLKYIRENNYADKDSIDLYLIDEEVTEGINSKDRKDYIGNTLITYTDKYYEETPGYKEGSGVYDFEDPEDDCYEYHYEDERVKSLRDKGYIE